jgi:hypothetical protein
MNDLITAKVVGVESFKEHECHSPDEDLNMAVEYYPT